MNPYFNNTPFFAWLWKHKWPVLIAELVAIAAVIVFTSPYFMKPLYRSSAVIYPANVKSYSTESPTEQLMQFLASVNIKNDVIRDFNLVKHYKIDTTNKYWYSKLLTEYDDNVGVSSTEYDAIKISVLDVSPDTACLMVKDIIKSLNGRILAAQREKLIEKEQMLKKQLDAKKREADSLSSLSKMLSVEYGLLDYPNQTREVAKAYYQALAPGRSAKSLDDATEQIKNLEEKGGQFNEVNLQLGDAVKAYDNVLVKYQTYLNEVNNPLTFTNPIAAPYPSDRKAFPIVWLDVLIAAVVMLICSVFLLRFIERIKTKPKPAA